MAREHYWPTGSKTAQEQEKRALAAEHDRQVRHRSTANDIRLDLPVSIARPDGEDYPSRPRLRSHDKRYEIQKPYIQGPPNKTVWDSIDCSERTVTQPSSSSSSSRSSSSKSSSSHWGLSWSRSNKSPPSQGRTSRGQSRHASNPSTSVRNPPSLSCETARGKHGGGSGGGQELLADPHLNPFIPSHSSSSVAASSLGTIPHSSPLGFHGAATSLVAGDTVHSAFSNHNHHQPPIPSASHQHHHPPPTNKPHKQESFVFSAAVRGAGAVAGGVGIPAGEDRFPEAQQQHHSTVTRTSLNNNNTSAATPLNSSSSASVLQRLIDPELKLFSRNSSCSSKESKRSNNNNANGNNGKYGKSHRTDQLSSASSSSTSAMVTDNNSPSCSRSSKGSNRTGIMCGGPSSSSTSMSGVERMMTTEDAYCCGADDDAVEDDGGAIHYNRRSSSSDMNDADDEDGLLIAVRRQQQGVGVTIDSDTIHTLKLSPQPPFVLSSPLSFNNSQQARMSSSVPSPAPPNMLFNCNDFKRTSDGAGDSTEASAAKDVPSSRLVLERKRNLVEPFSSSGYTTDPNYSTFASNNKMIDRSCRNNNSPPSPPSCSNNADKASCSDCSPSPANRSVQSQYGFVAVGAAASGHTKDCSFASSASVDNSRTSAKVGKETAHCELSETFIASSKNDNCMDNTDQYCTAAELTISSSSSSSTHNRDNNGESGANTSSSSQSSFSQSSTSSS